MTICCADTSLLDGPFVPDGHAYAYNGNLSPETHQQSGVSSGLASAGNGSAHPHAGPQHSLKHSEQAAEDMLSDMPHPLELSEFYFWRTSISPTQKAVPVKLPESTINLTP